MKVSIIIPTYKPKDYLWECLDSIYNQTLSKSEYEVILVLNGCSNPWYTEILEWKEKHLKINLIFIQTDTPGVSNARNIGIENATGEFITFIDDDDYISTNFLKNLLEISTNNSIAVSDSIFFDDTTGFKNYTNIHHKEFLDLQREKKPSLFKARRFFNGPCMKLIHKSIIGDRRFDIRLRNDEDSLFMALISDRIDQIILPNKETIYYRRIRSNSATTTKRTFKSRLRNCWMCIVLYITYWFKSPSHYNISFMLSRIAASIKSFILNKQ